MAGDPSSGEPSRSPADATFAAYRSSGDRRLRNRIVEQNLGLAEYFARRYRNRGVPDEDLRQIAMLGLVKAVERFDPDVGVQFSTFGGRTIDGELKRYFRDKTWSVRIPRRAQELVIEIRRATEALSHDLGRTPTYAEVADRIGVTLEEALEATDAGNSYRSLSIDRSVGDENGGGDRQAELGTEDHEFDATESRLVVEGLLSELPERERTILKLRFYERMSQSEIAAVVGISQMHVSRLLRRTLDRLRDQLP